MDFEASSKEPNNISLGTKGNKQGHIMSLENKRWIDPDEFAEMYGISTSTQAKFRMSSSSSTLPYSKIGGKFIRYDRVAIDKWLEDHQVQGGV